ncbi:hypothetical protein [Pseudomonas sp. MWU15-20650]|uniref:hypothetical protein n=1 Tax=Pseudomonas sp. MWU15-20650 TaxID=2933107 RepID=UPI00200D10B3|nr:hypothetical protein [Pseudomonas sp. MWU15-20650]
MLKFSGERLLVIACMDSVALLFVVFAVGFVSLPPLEIWPWIIASALFELLYRYVLIWRGGGGDRLSWSMLPVMLFGMRYLKEPFGRPRLIACGWVLIGMFVMKL